MAATLTGLGAPADAGRDAGSQENAELKSELAHDSTTTESQVIADVPGVGAVPFCANEVPEPLRSFVDKEDFDRQSGYCLCGQPITRMGSCSDPGCSGMPRYIGAAGRDEVRERAVLRLFYGAKRLSDGQLGVSPTMREFCVECRNTAEGGRDVVHSRFCRTGEVLAAIAQLQEQSAAAVLQTMEAQKPATALTDVHPDQPTPRNLLCMLCGERGGEWKKGRAVGDEGWFKRDNQRIAHDQANTGRYIYTHVCESAKTGGAQ